MTLLAGQRPPILKYANGSMYAELVFNKQQLDYFSSKLLPNQNCVLGIDQITSFSHCVTFSI